MITLSALRAHRSAPSLSPGEQEQIRSELVALLAACDWFTVGIMAPSASAAIAALRALEAALGWQPLALTPEAPVPADEDGGVFLKGNQATGQVLIQAEAGLGEGVLITGHCPERPEAEATWGPLPLAFFS